MQQCAELLIERGAEVNLASSATQGNSPLHFAVGYGQIKVCYPVPIPVACFGERRSDALRRCVPFTVVQLHAMHYGRCTILCRLVLRCGVHYMYGLWGVDLNKSINYRIRMK
eukprot:6205698-Pyramimonas_sp.AAC.1